MDVTDLTTIGLYVITLIASVLVVRNIQVHRMHVREIKDLKKENGLLKLKLSDHEKISYN